MIQDDIDARTERVRHSETKHESIIPIALA